MGAFDLQIDSDGLAVLTFDLPGEKVNKFSREVLEELAEVAARLRRESSIRALVLASGKPDVFIAGADIKEFLTTRPEEAERAVSTVQALFDSFARLRYPTVAAINGACLGGGTELSLTFDFRLMSDSRKAQIGLPEVRLGLFPAWGGCTRLPKLVGLPAALDVILTGKTLDARRAKKIGLVDEAVPAAIFDSFVRKFARQRMETGKPERRRHSALNVWVLELHPVGSKILIA